MPSTDDTDNWVRSESGFDTFDGTRLFYRIWQPREGGSTGARDATGSTDASGSTDSTAATTGTTATPSGPRVPTAPVKALVFLHRGHEHSGRIEPLVTALAQPDEWAFAWDARGHGFSPGERGDAPDFETLVRDFDAFIRHVSTRHGIAVENIVVVANSVGAVIAATWVHDYAPPIRGLVMAAAAFSIKLYVPFAKAGLWLATRFKPGLFVTSYIRSSMLTHSIEQARAYDDDPLITKSISARVLLDLAATARRIVGDAAAIHVPVLMLAADRDVVVHQEPQRLFFQRLSSTLKRYVHLPNSFHAVLYESEPTMTTALTAIREFIAECRASAPVPASVYLDADRQGASATSYQILCSGGGASPLQLTGYGLQQRLLSKLGPNSEGMRIGLTHGFDSGASLDHVYRNRAEGRGPIGRFIDRGYLDAIGWRGIRQRRDDLQQMLGDLINDHFADRRADTTSPVLSAPAPLRILDIATGSGRYVLETAKRFQDRPLRISLRDFQDSNLEAARQLAARLELRHEIDYQRRDAFDPASYGDADACYDIVIVSGLYELFSANAPVMRSLQGIRRQLRIGGHLIYTGQPWHPQLAMIAHTLTSHVDNQPWRMRPRSQAELDALVTEGAGCRKIDTRIGLAGIFTVSVARREQLDPQVPPLVAAKVALPGASPITATLATADAAPIAPPAATPAAPD